MHGNVLLKLPGDSNQEFLSLHLPVDECMLCNSNSSKSDGINLFDFGQSYKLIIRSLILQ